MQINEKLKNCPIKFYKNADDSIYYESAFVTGTTKTLNDAFKEIQKHDWEHDLIYYFADVIGVEFGAYEPALKDVKRKGRIYLGKINLKLDLDTGWGDGKDSITHLSRHPEDLPDHTKFLNKMRSQEKRDKFVKQIKNGFKKVAGYLTKQYEMFDPEKTRQDLICEHCGEVIPVATYYEQYQGNNYHLECIWDKLCNDKTSNQYQLARDYFFSLQEFIGKWPANFEIEDDYLMDLDLVKGNDRKTGLNENAAMKASPYNSFEEFYNFCRKNPKLQQKYYFICCNGKLRIPSDTINHAWKRHQTSCEQWLDYLSNVSNIQNAQMSKKKIQQRDVYLCRVLGYIDFGVVLMDCPNYFYVQTLFTDHPNSIDSWIETESITRQTGKPSASLGDNSSIRRVCAIDSNNIVTYLVNKIKG